ncbi:MAG TPA: phosphoribosyltransferase family protein [Pyrinomonadaceae bacterium]|nr:phosphoribosyltransferase family protein [Pyrinomonadaceae bacterium]
MTTEKFADLATAGVRLAELLRHSVTNETIVLGIATGGVPAAAVVAQELKLPLDIVLIKRLFAPHGPRFPVCATSVAGGLVLDDFSPHMNELAAPESFVDFSLRELARREHSCRGGRQITSIEGKSVILVDNGVHTGSTLSCAIRALRKLNALRVITAVPVIATESQPAIESITDDFIYLASHENFGHVGLWYSDFTKPADEDIRRMLENSIASNASNL